MNKKTALGSRFTGSQVRECSEMLRADVNGPSEHFILYWTRRNAAMNHVSPGRFFFSLLLAKGSTAYRSENTSGFLAQRTSGTV
jgi:hypothetical protein